MTKKKTVEIWVVTQILALYNFLVDGFFEHFLHHQQV